MYDALAFGDPSLRVITYTYFVSFVLLAQFIMINLFVAVILESFDEEKVDDENDPDRNLNMEDLEDFAKRWADMWVRKFSQRKKNLMQMKRDQRVKSFAHDSMGSFAGGDLVVTSLARDVSGRAGELSRQVSAAFGSIEHMALSSSDLTSKRRRASSMLQGLASRSNIKLSNETEVEGTISMSLKVFRDTVHSGFASLFVSDRRVIYFKITASWTSKTVKTHAEELRGSRARFDEIVDIEYPGIETFQNTKDVPVIEIVAMKDMGKKADQKIGEVIFYLDNVLSDHEEKLAHTISCDVKKTTKISRKRRNAMLKRRKPLRGPVVGQLELEMKYTLGRTNHNDIDPCVAGEQWLDAESVVQLIRELPRPLGMRVRNSKAELMRKIRALDVPMSAKHRAVHYKDVLRGLVKGVTVERKGNETKTPKEVELMIDEM